MYPIKIKAYKYYRERLAQEDETTAHILLRQPFTVDSREEMDLLDKTCTEAGTRANFKVMRGETKAWMLWIYKFQRRLNFLKNRK